jgi:hypothetical protein
MTLSFPQRMTWTRARMVWLSFSASAGKQSARPWIILTFVWTNPGNVIRQLYSGGSAAILKALS